MSLSPDLTLAEKALDALEQAEARSLVWGLVDSALSDDELTDLLRGVRNNEALSDLWVHPDCSLGTVSDLRRLLKELQMLFELPGAGEEPPRWRTRMAEGVRLMARLRQMFPKHAGPNGWNAAATLIADYRFLWRPRHYPKRNQTGEQAMAAIETRVSDAALLAPLQHWLKKASAKVRLSNFQVTSTTRILHGLETGHQRGTLVSAGTGSGKTLAFYLPALGWLASQRKANPAATGVRVLALYPRNELLKDQLREVYGQCRLYDEWLGQFGASPLRVGVLFGGVPHSANSAFGGKHSWPGDYQARVCPFFRCPNCTGEMLLRRADLDQKVERLVCRDCGNTVDDRQFAFTRNAMKARPPDLLFTSVEMLNQNLSDGSVRHLFGLGPKARRAPDLVLLDEVHLYAGTYGAQVGYLLRRWRHLSGRRSSFVGLSATIADGQAFFAALTGLDPSVVEEISPKPEEMEEEGAEYMLALRGDPVSQTALLSASIQSLMLGSRLLQPRDSFDRRAQPFCGWRSFAFTDQLDAANRLYRDFKDAEGAYLNGAKKPTRGSISPVLADLRKSQEPPARRYLAGQDWRAVEAIGHDLAKGQDVARTTSYDSGVNLEAQVIVATAALEVGFDDPDVGLVLQHKAPRDVAQFLQRKGRAGRTRHMRPWTMVVLSDYGRDRQAYQSYDQLFNPTLPARQLPMSNRYVQRMQAVYALLDDLGERTQNDPSEISVWRALGGPARSEQDYGWSIEQLAQFRALAKEGPPRTEADWKSLRNRAIKITPQNWDGWNWLQSRMQHSRLLAELAQLLRDNDAAQAWSVRLGALLGLPRDEVELLQWSHPRPVMLGAIPTAVRRLASNWRWHEMPGQDYQGRNPLPDYVPAALFSDLSLPELGVEVPQGRKLSGVHYMPVQQGLAEFAPGRVSLRFDDPLWLGVSNDELQALVALDQEVVHQDAQVSDWYELGSHMAAPLHHADAPSGGYKAYTPIVARLQLSEGGGGGAPGARWQVGKTSNGRLIWVSNLHMPRKGLMLQAPPAVGICQLLAATWACTHAGQSAALVRRYATGSRADLRVEQGKSRHPVTVHWHFMDGEAPCAIGFEIDTDALVFALNLPEDLSAAIDWSDGRRLRAARTARYTWECKNGPELTAVVANPFLRDWLGQVYQTTALWLARIQRPLRTALDELAQGQHQDVLDVVLRTVFQALDDEDEDLPEDKSDRLRQSLETELHTPDVLAALRKAAQVLVDPIGPEWNEWLSLTLRTTLGAALLEGIQQACPQIDGDSLVVDIEPGPHPDGSPPLQTQIWVSEVNPGGNGLIEQVVDLMATQPEALFRHVEAALNESEFEVTERQLRETLHALAQESAHQDLANAFAAVRHAQSSSETRDRFAELRVLLVQRGQAVYHGYAVALSLRLLRQEYPRELDVLLARVLSAWDDLEGCHGIEVDVRLVCALFSDDASLDQALAAAKFELPNGDRRSWRFSVLLGLLWARGHALRAVALPLSNRYCNATAASERLLLSQWLTTRQTPIDPRQSDWQTQLHERLVQGSRATVSVPTHEAAAYLPALVQEAMTMPVQYAYLNVYARLAAVKRVDGHIEWTFEIPESA